MSIDPKNIKIKEKDGYLKVSIDVSDRKLPNEIFEFLEANSGEARDFDEKGKRLIIYIPAKNLDSKNAEQVYNSVLEKIDAVANNVNFILTGDNYARYRSATYESYIDGLKPLVDEYYQLTDKDQQKDKIKEIKEALKEFGSDTREFYLKNILEDSRNSPEEGKIAVLQSGQRRVIDDVEKDNEFIEKTAEKVQEGDIKLYTLENTKGNEITYLSEPNRLAIKEKFEKATKVEFEITPKKQEDTKPLEQQIAGAQFKIDLTREIKDIIGEDIKTLELRNEIDNYFQTSVRKTQQTEQQFKDGLADLLKDKKFQGKDKVFEALGKEVPKQKAQEE